MTSLRRSKKQQAEANIQPSNGSIPLWFVGAMVSDTGVAPWLYWSMPPVAGMAWAWLLSVILAKVRSPRR